MSADIRVEDRIQAIPAAAWNGLAGGNPFLSHGFLSALEETGCVGPGSGWNPRFLALWREGSLAGAMPLYLKAHSYGEYVFDWAWADAYSRHGLRYYPKLVCSVPFTPVSGRRLLAATAGDRRLLLKTALGLAGKLEASSLHILFPTGNEAEEMRSQGLLLRHGVQFHWSNAGFASFENYLTAMSHAKRKNIRQERRKVADAGITFAWRSGREITESDWAFFTRCYERTYRRHRSTPYLNLAFFLRLGAALPENVLLCLGYRQSRPVAAALHLRWRDTLYGRYWGATEYHPGLHFETCYYQAIEYCIAHGIRRFEGGAQGEHKLARGFLPERTWSAHWLAHPGFAAAVDDYLQREARGVAQYIDELNEAAPYKAPAGPP
ncbi:MAG: N-acetyltransferase [Betaproteobacteria bacterium]|nr:N-acetyltransferase [Betaproteobacteria bacterium]